MDQATIDDLKTAIVGEAYFLLAMRLKWDLPHTVEIDEQASFEEMAEQMLKATPDREMVNSAIDFVSQHLGRAFGGLPGDLVAEGKLAISKLANKVAAN